jgi:hypothetical protein
MTFPDSGRRAIPSSATSIQKSLAMRFALPNFRPIG